MRLGVHVGYWAHGVGAAEQLRMVQAAEALGYHSAWTSEAYGSDAATVLGWLAHATTRIRLGAAVFQMAARSPTMTAMTTATPDRLSGGRLFLGLGTSGTPVVEGWHGRRFDRPLHWTREYVAVVRMALARERVEFHGQTIELPLPRGPGKALKLTTSPVQERVPIYLAALGPRNVALAGEIADGWLPVYFAPEHAGAFRAQLEAGAARARRSLAGFDVAPMVNVHVAGDATAARDAMRAQLALYVGGMGSRAQNFYNALVRRYGFDRAAQEVQDLYLAGEKDAAAAALPADLIDMVTLCGPPEVVRDRLARYRAAGVTTLIAGPVGHTVDARIEQLRLLADVAAA